MKKVISIRLLHDFIFVFLILFMLLPRIAVSQTVPVLTFAIKDQFDSLHTEKDYLGSVTVIIGSDRAGSAFNGIWTKAIQDSVGNKLSASKIKYLPVANVSSVPFFLKGFVQGKFPEARNEWVLMDWKGYFSDTYKFAEDSCNIVIIAKDGRLVYKTSGQTVDNQKLTTICRKITELHQVFQK